MRRLALLALLSLAACGSGNDAGGNASGGFEGGFRTKYREQFVAQCETAAKNAAKGAPIDFGSICGCAADKLLAGKSPTELLTGPSEAEQVALMRQCVAENPPKVG